MIHAMPVVFRATMLFYARAAMRSARCARYAAPRALPRLLMFDAVADDLMPRRHYAAYAG